MDILLVEDNPGDARLICEMLREADHDLAHVRTARSLKEARELGQDHASVATVLLDLGLPDSDGIDTLIGIREAYPDSAIVVLTVFDNEEMTLRALREGAQSYLTKNDLTAGILGNTLRYARERHRFISRLREEEQRNAELRVNEELIRGALANEQQLNALRSEFLAMVSHEFRTPLAIIQSAADLIERHTLGPDSAKVLAFSSRIRMKVRELTALLNEVLDMEKLEQHALVRSIIEFDLIQLVRSVLSEMRPLLRDGQELVFFCNEKECTVQLDPRMVRNILTNLLSNAIKYSPAGGTITTRLGIDAHAVHIAVEDSGIGIPAEEQGLLFERYFRGSNATAIQGTGLGLPIVKQYLALLDGTISFNTIPGRTVFDIRLPRNVTSITSD